MNTSSFLQFVVKIRISCYYNTMKTWVTFFDILIILFVMGVTFFAAYLAYMKPQERVQILVRGQGNDWIFPIEAEETVIVSGLLGETIVRISGQRVWVEASPCENQNCVASGFITRQGQWAACLPNNVLVLVQGEYGGDIDAVVW
jgi:hypothetical protein